MKNYRGKDYRCGDCGVAELKLWRQGSSSCIELRCATCAVVDQTRRANLRGASPPSGIPFDFIDREFVGIRGAFCDQIGTLLPAVPTPEGDGFWNYGRADSESCRWWYARPTYADDSNDLKVERVLRAFYFDKFQDAAESILERNAR